MSRFITILLMFFALMLYGCQSKQTAEQKEQDRNLSLQLSADQVVAQTFYMKDSRIDACYKYRWGTIAFDGPDLTLMSVPCNIVPSEKMLFDQKVVNETNFMKDPRDGLCQIFHWGTIAFDGPSLALTSVPCEKIPTALLIPGKK